MRVCCCAVASCAFPQAGKQTQHYPRDRSSSQATTCTQVSMHTYKAAPNLAPTHIQSTHVLSTAPDALPKHHRRPQQQSWVQTPWKEHPQLFSRQKWTAENCGQGCVCKHKRDEPLCKHLTNANKTTTVMMWIQHRSHLARQEPSKQQTGYEQMSSALKSHPYRTSPSGYRGPTVHEHAGHVLNMFGTVSLQQPLCGCRIHTQ